MLTLLVGSNENRFSLTLLHRLDSAVMFSFSKTNLFIHSGEFADRLHMHIIYRKHWWSEF